MRRRSKRKWIWIILAMLSVVTVALIISFSEVENQNVAESKAEKTKISVSRQDSKNSEDPNMPEEDTEVTSDKSSNDISTSDTEKKGSSSNVSSNNKPEESASSKPTHKHEWEAVTKTKKNKSQVPVYGDVCRTCHEDVTGIGDIHILEGNCTGYDTDVIISYKEITETVNYTVYECSCGATK